jgi:hypothetical protein
MKSIKLQMALANYVAFGKRIAKLEERKNEIAELRSLKEKLAELSCCAELSKYTLAEWQWLYEKELRLELEILKLKTAQAKFMLDRLTEE